MMVIPGALLQAANEALLDKISAATAQLLLLHRSIGEAQAQAAAQGVPQVSPARRLWPLIACTCSGLCALHCQQWHCRPAHVGNPDAAGPMCAVPAGVGMCKGQSESGTQW